MKRLSAPKFWMVSRKEKRFVVRPSPGAHRKDRCIPITVVLRDVLKYAANAKEAKQIVKKGLVEVDGRTESFRR